MKPPLVSMKPLPFFIGIIVGLATLSWAGAHVRSAEWTRQFTRFHQLISPESNYFPTIRQIKQIIDAVPKEKVFIIVGGTSIFYGVGQPDSVMWTRQLQTLLGERFRVLNFAQRGGTSNEFGNIAAEILLQRHARVIYLADGVTDSFTYQYSIETYLPVIAEAWMRGDLIPWQPRDDLLRLHIKLAPDRLQSVFLETVFDRILNFKDFWNYFEFEIGNLNWTLFLADRILAPRAKFHDNEDDAEAANPYPYPDSVEVEEARGRIIPIDDKAGWAFHVHETEATIPPELRRITLGTIHLGSPRFLNQLSADQHAAYIATANYHAAELKKIGFAECVVSGIRYTEQDYVDGLHMSVSGGEKLAAMLAPKVLALAQSLGYIQ
jgi:hypothetical protein